MLQTIGLFKTMPGLIFIEIAFGLPFCILLFRAFISTVPRELDEAAIVDGAGPLQVFFRVIFPVLRSVVITVIILQSVFVYNDFQNPLYFLPGTQNATVQLTLFSFRSQFTTQFNLLFANILLVMLPALIMFIIFNRKIVEGMAAGAATARQAHGRAASIGRALAVEEDRLRRAIRVSCSAVQEIGGSSTVSTPSSMRTDRFGVGATRSWCSRVFVAVGSSSASVRLSPRRIGPSEPTSMDTVIAASWLRFTRNTATSPLSLSMVATASTSGTASVLRRLVARALDGEPQHRAPGQARGDGEREEDGLPPGRAAGLGHDRRDHIDELRKARGLHPVGVLQQADEQASDDHRVGHGVLVLEQPGRVRPRVHVGDLSALVEAVGVPDVPLVERDVDGPLAV